METALRTVFLILVAGAVIGAVFALLAVAIKHRPAKDTVSGRAKVPARPFPLPLSPREHEADITAPIPRQARYTSWT